MYFFFVKYYGSYRHIFLDFNRKTRYWSATTFSIYMYCRVTGRNSGNVIFIINSCYILVFRFIMENCIWRYIVEI